MATWNAPYKKFLTEYQALQNAQNIATYLTNRGWHKLTICALCGNAWHESSINPNMYELGYAWSANRGYGLFQWTPRSKLEGWAKSQGLDFRLGETQLKRLTYEVENNIQYYPTSNYKESFKQFKNNTFNKSLNYLVECFMYNYERPNLSVANLQARKNFANKCLEKLKFDGVTNGKDKEENPQGYEGDKPIKEVISDNLTPPNFENINISVNDIGELIANFTKNLQDTLNEILTVDLYSLSQYEYSNSFLTITKQLNNMYKIRPNLDFYNIFDNIISKLKNFEPIDDGIINNNPNENKPITNINTGTVTPNNNENIKKMTEKAFSIPTKSVKYSMYGARDMITSGDCSSFINVLLNHVGQKVGNGGTPDLYNFARSRGWLVVDGYQKDVENIIQKAREGDYILMAQNNSFQYGGSSHVVYVYASNWIRHQTSSAGGYAPVNDKLDTYLRNARDYWAYRFALCRPFKN